MGRIRRSGVTVSLLLVLGSLTACSSGSAGRSQDGSTTAVPSTTPVAPTVHPTTTIARTPARITIAFAGDISFEPPRAGLLTSNPGAILGAITPALQDADLTVANLETAIGTRGTPAPKAFTFQTTPDALAVLKNAGIDVASMANNHGLDYGHDGVPDALAASQAQDFPLIGIGENEDQAMAPYRTTIRGNRVAVIGATQVLDDELIPAWTATEDHPGLASAKRVDRLVAQVRQVRPGVDTLVVFLHWGIETHTCPSGDQAELARRLVDAGADVIVGGHAHRVQGGGRLGDAVVHYGLGNFAFYAGSEAAATTGVFTVETGGGKPADYRWLPARIDGNGSPVPLSGAAATEAAEAWNAQRSCTGLEP